MYKPTIFEVDGRFKRYIKEIEKDVFRIVDIVKTKRYEYCVQYVTIDFNSVPKESSNGIIRVAYPIEELKARHGDKYKQVICEEASLQIKPTVVRIGTNTEAEWCLLNAYNITVSLPFD